MDIALIFNPGTLSADMAIDGSDLATDNTLRTAVLISVYTDRRANDDDILPDDARGAIGGYMVLGSGNRRGWWGDWYSPDALAAVRAGGTLPKPTDFIGSRMWLLAREKEVASVLARAKQYLEEALAWLVDDGVATRVDVTTEIDGQGVLVWEADIWKPDGTMVSTGRFQYAWGGL